MAYIKLDNNVVVQKQPNPSEGFVEAWDGVVCGMTHDGTSSYLEANFTSPPIPGPSWTDVKEKQRAMIVKHDDMMTIHEREIAHTGTSTTTIPEAKYQEFLGYFQTIRQNDEALHATPEAAIAALDALVEPSLS